MRQGCLVPLVGRCLVVKVRSFLTDIRAHCADLDMINRVLCILPHAAALSNIRCHSLLRTSILPLATGTVALVDEWLIMGQFGATAAY